MRFLKKSGGLLTSTAVAAALTAKGLTDAEARAAVSTAASLVEGLIALGLMPAPVPTPTPGGTPTPDGPLEPLMDPPNMTLRSTYSVTKVDGIANDVYPEMYNADGSLTGNGNYWGGGNCPKAPHPLWPDRRYSYNSPDHGPGTGASVGIYMSVCVGDPFVPTNWKTLREAYDAGWMPELTARPTSDIVFKGAPGSTQPETPWVVRDDQGFIMAYQTGANALWQDGSGPYGTQATLRATSADGINWTGDLVAWAETPRIDGGPSFTSYLRFAPNELFTEVPYAWIAFGLGGLYGLNNPRTENWTLISRTAHQGVRAVGELSSGYLIQKGRFDPTTARQTPQGIAMVAHIGVETSGAGMGNGGLYEILIAPDGVEILGLAQAVIVQGPDGSADRWSVGLGSHMVYGAKEGFMYEGAANLDGTKTKKRNLLAFGPRRNPGNTRFKPLNPPTPPLASMNIRELSFRNGAMPEGVTAHITGTPSIRFDAEFGIVITLKDGDKVVLVEDLGFDPNTTDMADFLVRGWSVLSDNAWRVPWFGFTADPGHLADMQDMRALTFNPTNGYTGSAYHARNGGTATTTAYTSTAYESAFEGYGAGSTIAKVRKDVGIKWWPRSANNAATRMVFGGAETQSLTNAMTFAAATRAKRWHRFIAFEGTGDTEVAVRGWRLREGGS
jgi:hypothetical protein